MAGQKPEQQIFPALKWLRGHLGHRKWYVVGANYIWLVRSIPKTAMAVADLRLEIVGSRLVERGDGGYPLLSQTVAASGCDAGLMMLVGQDLAEFNRVFTEAGLQGSITHYGPLMDEYMLLASGVEATTNLYSSASYFRTLTSPEAVEFWGSARYGVSSK